MAVADRQTRTTGQTRLHVSTTVRTHRRRPSNSSSCIQSIAQTWFGPVALLRSPHAVQNPDRPGEVAVILRGEDGTGKGKAIKVPGFFSAAIAAISPKPNI